MHGQETSAHGLEALALAHELLTLPGESPVPFLLFGGNPHDTERFAVAPCEAVQPQTEGLRIEAVILHALAPLVPVLGLNDVVSRGQCSTFH